MIHVLDLILWESAMATARQNLFFLRPCQVPYPVVRAQLVMGPPNFPAAVADGANLPPFFLFIRNILQL